MLFWLWRLTGALRGQPEVAIPDYVLARFGKHVGSLLCREGLCSPGTGNPRRHACGGFLHAEMIRVGFAAIHCDRCDENSVLDRRGS